MLELDHLRVAYGARDIIADFSVQGLQPGQVVALLGPNGSGKSTLLKVVAGLLEADSGHVTINGKSVREASRDKAIGLVPQSPALLPWRTIVDNVRLPLELNPAANTGRTLRDAEELLTCFGLGAAMRRYPAQVSGGMQQRVSIARAFVFDPDLLLMDEPFSALDEMNREQQRMGLLDFWQSNQKSVLFVTHSIPEAIILSDRIVLMSAHPGRIAEIIPVHLPRPRHEMMYASPAFHALEDHVRQRLRTVAEARDGE